MKNIVAISIILLLSGFSVFAQVGINTDNSTPDPSAMLDVKSANKGFLPPRVALTALNIPDPLVTPAVGLIIYNTANAGTFPNDVSAGYYWWNGMKWISVSAPQGTSAGDMLYWNGTQWVNVPVGINGQSLILNNGVPTWGNPSAQSPSLITNAVSGITNESAVSGGNVSDGGAPVTQRGVCWGISPNPAISGNKTTDGSGPGLFTSDLTGLAASTTYYVRAYATNSVGTSYGNEVSFSTPTFVIGQNFGGGIIFYIDETGQKVLIAAPGDQSTGTIWGCEGTSIPGNFSAIGTGQANTLAIVSSCSTAGIAARICNDLVLGGYDDWFLPSKDELNQMYNARSSIFFNLTYNVYWSSSQAIETPSLEALSQSFYNGAQGLYLKNYEAGLCVRAIRAFPSVAPPTVTTATASNIAPTSVTIGGVVTSAGNATVTAKGVCWSASSNPTLANGYTTDGAGTGSFVSNLTGLLPANVYHVRAYATSSAGTSYGNDVSFSTPATVPSVITLSVTGITPTGATFGGNVTSDGGSPLIIKSFEYKLIPDINSPGGTVAPNQGTALGIYTWTTDFLRANTVYYVWAQAGNAIGNTIGNMVTFTTLPAVIPTVTTTTVTSITQTTATSGGNITSDGGDWVTARGVCWSTSPTPLISSGNFTLDGPWAGPFVSTITGLTGNTLYYIRAYATNSAGTSYGDELSFTTLPTAPTVVTLPVTGITQTGATFGGNVTSDGGSPVLSRSFLAGTSPDINAASMATTNLGPGTGNFTYTWGSFLTPNTVYYVWARAGNSVGNATGNMVTFTTLPAVAPTLTTAPVTNITQTTATSGGTITLDGGAFVTAKGVCWSTSPTPLISSNNFTQDGTGSGPFVSNITGLTGNTMYYVRAYATNSAGTSYGGEDTITTLPVEGTVTTTVVTNIAQTSATSGGTVTSDGGAAVTARGICWGTARQPTILANGFTTNGTGIGPFTSSITNLSPGTLYYVRAY
ncbi:MAG: hypothetical protein WCK09_21035, partial [Bacteroidota bacterium]